MCKELCSGFGLQGFVAPQTPPIIQAPCITTFIWFIIERFGPHMPSVAGKLAGWMEGWSREMQGPWKGGCMVGRRGGWMDGWMHGGWMDAWMRHPWRLSSYIIWQHAYTHESAAKHHVYTTTENVWVWVQQAVWQRVQLQRPLKGPLKRPLKRDP